MEFLVVVVSGTLQGEVESFLERAGIGSWTKLGEVTGAGRGGGVRQNDDVWPGFNSLYLVCAPPGPAAKLKEFAREYRRGAVREGFKVFAFEPREVI